MNIDPHAFDWLDSSATRKAVKKDYQAARKTVSAFMEKHMREILTPAARHLISARSIGIPIKRGTMIFDSEEEMMILYDYMLMVEIQDGNTRISNFLANFPREGADKETELALRCLSSSRYTFLYAEEAIDGVGLKCLDLVTGEPLFLTDINFSHSLTNGASIFIGTDILSHGQAWMTTGVAMPIILDRRMSRDELDGLLRNDILKNVKCKKCLPFQPDARQQAGFSGQSSPFSASAWSPFRQASSAPAS